MSNYFPDINIQTSDTITAEGLNKPLRKAIGTLASLDRENIPDNALTVAKLKANALNKFNKHYSTTTTTYTSGQISRGWFPIPVTQHSFAAEEGMLIIQFSGTIERYPITSVDFKPWTVGLFVDGRLVAESGFIFANTYGINLGAAIPVIAGTTDIYLAFKGEVYTPTVGGSTTSDIFSVHTFMCWERNAKR